MLGAFGVHALRGHLDENALSIWHTAAEYQFWHVVALMAIAGFAPSNDSSWSRAGWIMIAGTIIFCTSLYALTLGAPAWVGAVTPVGGLLLVIGWVLVGVAFWCSASNK